MAKEKKKEKKTEEAKKEETKEEKKAETKPEEKKTEEKKKPEENKEERAEKSAEVKEKKTKVFGEKPEEVKKASDKYFLITIVVILLAVAVFFAAQQFYQPGPKYEVVDYNGFEFVRMADLWYFNWQKGDEVFVVSLNYNPYEVDHIQVFGDVDDRFKQQNVYITHDPAETGLSYVTLATAELASNLITTQNLVVTAACTENKTDYCGSAPIITCDNTNESVIYLKKSEEARIDLNGNCMTIRGKDEELVKAAEKALYIWYKII